MVCHNIVQILSQTGQSSKVPQTKCAPGKKLDKIDKIKCVFLVNHFVVKPLFFPLPKLKKMQVLSDVTA